MRDFLLQSLIASIVLTIIINVLPRLFPDATRKAERQVHEKLEEAFQEREDGTRPKMRMFFPWKAMLIASLVLTVLVNLAGRVL